jgi:hypothetical protein
VVTNGSWVTEESISLSAVRVYRAARQAVATLERDLDKLGRFQDPTEGGRFQKGEKVVTTQLVETAGGLRVKTTYGWVSMVAVSGVVLLEPWQDPRTIDVSGITTRKKPPSHRTAQKFAEIDGILGLPRFPAMKPFHGAVLHNPGLRGRDAPMRHGPLLPPPPASVGSGLVKRKPERLALALPELDAALDGGLDRQMAASKSVAKEQLLPLSTWSDHLAQSRSRFGLATPPSMPPPTSTFRRLHPSKQNACSKLAGWLAGCLLKRMNNPTLPLADMWIVCACTCTASARPTQKPVPSIMYSPGSYSRPEPLPRSSLAAARLTQSARARLGGGPGSARSRGIAVAPLLSFADSQDTLTDALSSTSLSRSVAVAPLPTSARTSLNVRSVAPPLRPVQPKGSKRRQGGRGGGLVEMRRRDQLALYSETDLHKGIVLGGSSRR